MLNYGMQPQQQQLPQRNMRNLCCCGGVTSPPQRPPMMEMQAFQHPLVHSPPPQVSGGCCITCCGPPSGTLFANTGSTYAALVQERPAFQQSLFPCCTDLCEEFRFEKLTLCILPYERQWIKQYGETMFSTSPGYNVVLKGTFSCVMLYAQMLSTHGWGSNQRFYAIYLTYWTLTMQNAYHLANFGMALQVVFRSNVGPLPYSIQITTALRAVAEPCALIVTMLYTLGTHFADRSLTNVMVHAVNGCVIVLDALTGRQTSRLANNLWGFLYFLTYMMWTLVHYKMRIGNQFGDRCIYNGFCWHEPKVASLNFLLIFTVIMPMTSLFLGFVVWVRDRLISDTDRQRYLAANPDHDPWGACRVSLQAVCCVLPFLCLAIAVWHERQCQVLDSSYWSSRQFFVCVHNRSWIESDSASFFSAVQEYLRRMLKGLKEMEAQ